jgi:hypothetical protein
LHRGAEGSHICEKKEGEKGKEERAERKKKVIKTRTSSAKKRNALNLEL